MDSNLDKRYCRNKIRKTRKNIKKNYKYSYADVHQKDERQFKLDRFVKDVQAFRETEQPEKESFPTSINDREQENINKVQNILQNKQQQHPASKKIVLKDKVKRKRGLFDYGHMTTSFTRGMLGKPNVARFDQDLRKIIGLANLKNTTTNKKQEVDNSSVYNEPRALCSQPTGTEVVACSSVTTVQMVEGNKTKGPSLGKESYPEFTRLVNQSLAMEKYKNFKNENYAKEIKIQLRNIYLQRLRKTQCEKIASTEKSSTKTSCESCSSSPVFNCNKENYLHHNELQTIPQYRSTKEYLKETLGVCPTPPVDRSPEIILTPYERPTFEQHIPRFYNLNTSRDNYNKLESHCYAEHIRQPVSKLPYPQEYILSYTHDHKSSPVLCLPHPAAKYLDNHLARPLRSVHSTYGTQRNLEIIDGYGDWLQESLFPLPPKEPSPEFQHYPFQRF